MIHEPAQLAELLGIPFSEEQRAAITAPMAPSVVIAGAGTGKTTVMAARVVWLVATGAVQPGEVLGLTFTRKAAGELSQRIDHALRKLADPCAGSDPDEERQLVMTYDAFAGRLVADHAPRIGVDPAARILNDAARFRLASQVVAEADGDWDLLGSWSPGTLVRRLLDLDAALAQHLVEPEALEAFTQRFMAQLAAAPPLRGGGPGAAVIQAGETAQARSELLGLVRAYRQAKKRLGVAEFADQMAQAARIATEVPEVSALVRRQFRVVLLDEYQDTSAAQALMLSGLFSGPTPEQGRGHPVTAVGDPYQGIYGWRGAAASNMAEFARRFPEADGEPCRIDSLTLNRRSGQAILDVANELAAGLGEDPAMPHFGKGSARLHAAEPEPPAYVSAAGFDTEDEELDWIGDDIVTRGGESHWGDIAVLTRRNATIPALYRRLVDREVPVEIVGLGGLLRVEPVREVVSVLRLLADDTDNAALVQLLSSRRWRLSPDDLSALGRAAGRLAADQEPATVEKEKGGPGQEETRAPLGVLGARVSRPPVCLMDAIDTPIPGISAVGSRRLARCHGELLQLRRLVGRPLRELVIAVVTTLHVDSELEAEAGLYARDRRAQLTAFLEVVGDFTDLDGTARLDGFLAYLAAESELDDDMEQAVVSTDDSVKLLTVHRAKGLEWPIVYLPALVEGTFPARPRGDNWTTAPQLLPGRLRGDADSIPQLLEATRKGLEEHGERLREAARFAEERLAYVAATRAKTLLVATTHIWEAGRRTPGRPSPYYRVVEAKATERGTVQHRAGPVAEQNPLGEQLRTLPWPEPVDPDNQQRLDALARDVASGNVPEASGGELDADEAETARAWRVQAESLVDTELQDREQTRLVVPESLSASALMESQRNPSGFVQGLVRPMPRRATTGAGVGTRFHEWLERRFHEQASLLGGELLDETGAGDDTPWDVVPGAAHDAEADIRFTRLVRRFEQGPYAERTPCRTEVPFVLVLAGRQIRGRIDAVYRLDGTEGFDYQVVDWKTFEGPADPLQLALYRQAWSDATGTPPERIDAVFHHVTSGAQERPERLAGIAELARIVADLDEVAARRRTGTGPHGHAG